MQNYIKYYWIESEYLEKEVFLHFDNKGYLTPEQFFSILFWKSKRPIKKWVRPQLPNESVKSLTREISSSPTKSDTGEKEKLDVLLGQSGFGIAMASAVLSVLYPTDYTVYDYRAREQLNKECFKKYRKEGKLLRDISAITNDIANRQKIKKTYWEFVEIVKRIAEDKGLTLRNCDRYLWGKSWYEDLEKFIEAPKNIMCLCAEPLCGKCLSVNCEDENCKTHTQENKDRWKRRHEGGIADNSVVHN